MNGVKLSFFCRGVLELVFICLRGARVCCSILLFLSFLCSYYSDICIAAFVR